MSKPSREEVLAVLDDAIALAEKIGGAKGWLVTPGNALCCAEGAIALSCGVPAADLRFRLGLVYLNRIREQLRVIPRTSHDALCRAAKVVEAIEAKTNPHKVPARTLNGENDVSGDTLGVLRKARKHFADNHEQ